MTETEWLDSDDWRPMLEYHEWRISKRKGTLYVCAGVRTIWELLYDDRSRKGVEFAERAADGETTRDEVLVVAHLAENPTFGYTFESRFLQQYYPDGDYPPEIKRLLEMGIYSISDIGERERLGDPVVVSQLINAAHIVYHSLYQITDNGIEGHLLNHLESQRDWPGGWLVREIFGNPFRETAFNPDWRSETVLDIARGAYEERAFDRLAVLSDALLDAGCDDGDLLAHLRNEGPHFKGSWALDKVLGL